MIERDDAAADTPDAVHRMLADGLNTLALDSARRIAASAQGNARDEASYLAALASARMGAIAEAEDWLERVDIARITDRQLAADIASLGGRLAKDRYALTRGRDAAPALRYARVALERYRHAFEISGGAYPAVNAATMAKLVGDEASAQTFARHALAAAAHEKDGHWVHAARGEAFLALGRIDDARAAYRLAHAAAGRSFGDIAAMRRQLALIDADGARSLLECVPAPAVIAFSGHMIDAPGRTRPRFPPALEPVVADALCRRLASYGAAIGFAQAACGSDILFLEAMQDSGMPTHVVLPCATDDFIDASVRFAGEQWVARFERTLARATASVLATDEPLLGDTALFAHTANLIHGMARLAAAELTTEPLLLTVSEPGGAYSEGGTAASARLWAQHGRRIDTIDLAALRGTEPSPPESREPEAPPSATASRRTLKSLVFADIKGFSRMPEQFTPRFAETFLGTCRRLLDSLEHGAVDANSRGDGVFLVFERPLEAAQFAVRLQHELTGVDWPAIGLPRETSARIGLHTGPVFRTWDPVMNKQTFYGTHVNRAARLEPIVRPGHVFATEAFVASLLATDAGDRFACHYLGAMPLAKQFGEARLYRVVPQGED